MASRRNFLKSLSLAGLGFHLKKMEPYIQKNSNASSLKWDAALNSQGPSFYPTLNLPDDELLQAFQAHYSFLNNFISLNQDFNSAKSEFSWLERSIITGWQLDVLHQRSTAIQNLGELIKKHAEHFVIHSQNSLFSIEEAIGYSFSLIIGLNYFLKSKPDHAFNFSWRRALECYLDWVATILKMQDSKKMQDTNRPISNLSPRAFRGADALLLIQGLESAAKTISLVFPFDYFLLKQRCLILKSQLSTRFMKYLDGSELIPGEWNHANIGLYAQNASLTGLHGFYFTSRYTGLSLSDSLKPEYVQLGWIETPLNPYFTKGKAISGVVQGDRGLDYVNLQTYILSCFQAPFSEASKIKVEVIKEICKHGLLPKNIHRDQITSGREQADPVSAALFIGLILSLFGSQMKFKGK